MSAAIPQFVNLVEATTCFYVATIYTSAVCQPSAPPQSAHLCSITYGLPGNIDFPWYTLFHPLSSFSLSVLPLSHRLIVLPYVVLLRV